MKLLKYYGVIVIFIIFVGCTKTIESDKTQIRNDGLLYEINSAKPFTGKVIEQKGSTSPSIIISEIEYVDGIKEGTAKYYTDKGVIEKEMHISKGILIDEYNEWYSDGQRRLTGVIKSDNNISELKSWDYSGNATGPVYYVKDIYALFNKFIEGNKIEFSIIKEYLGVPSKEEHEFNYRNLTPDSTLLDYEYVLYGATGLKRMSITFIGKPGDTPGVHFSMYPYSTQDGGFSKNNLIEEMIKYFIAKEYKRIESPNHIQTFENKKLNCIISLQDLWYAHGFLSLFIKHL